MIAEWESLTRLFTTMSLTSGSLNVDADVFWSGDADGAKAGACAPHDPVHGNPSASPTGSGRADRTGNTKQ